MMLMILIGYCEIIVAIDVRVVHAVGMMFLNNRSLRKLRDNFSKIDDDVEEDNEEDDTAFRKESACSRINLIEHRPHDQRDDEHRRCDSRKIGILSLDPLNGSFESRGELHAKVQSVWRVYASSGGSFSRSHALESVQFLTLHRVNCVEMFFDRQPQVVVISTGSPTILKLLCSTWNLVLATFTHNSCAWICYRDQELCNSLTRGADEAHGFEETFRCVHVSEVDLATLMKKQHFVVRASQ